MSDQSKSISLALIGLLTASVISIFQSSGHYDLFDCFTGVMLFCIAEAYRDEAPESGPGNVAFAMIEGAALFLIISPLNFFNMQYGNDFTRFALALTWVALSFFAAYRRRKGWTWPF
jgi:hypothetical protein